MMKDAIILDRLIKAEIALASMTVQIACTSQIVETNAALQKALDQSVKDLAKVTTEFRDEQKKTDAMNAAGCKLLDAVRKVAKPSMDMTDAINQAVMVFDDGIPF